MNGWGGKYYLEVENGVQLNLKRFVELFFLLNHRLQSAIPVVFRYPVNCPIQNQSIDVATENHCNLILNSITLLPMFRIYTIPQQ